MSLVSAVRDPDPSDQMTTRMFTPGRELQSHKDELWDILTMTDYEFIPPLSDRHPITLGAMEPAPHQWDLPIEHLEFLLDLHVILGWVGDKVVGFLSFLPDFSHETIRQYPSCVYIDTVAVLPFWRRKGMARELYRVLFSSEVFQRHDDAVMHTWSTNDSHGALVEALGFDEIDRIPDERAQGVDTVVFHRPTKPNPFAS